MDLMASSNGEFYRIGKLPPYVFAVVNEIGPDPENLALVAFGLMMVYSTTFDWSYRSFGDASYVSCFSHRNPALLNTRNAGCEDCFGSDLASRHCLCY